MNGIFSQGGSELPKFYFGKIMVANEVCELFLSKVTQLPNLNVVKLYKKWNSGNLIKIEILFSYILYVLYCSMSIWTILEPFSLK